VIKRLYRRQPVAGRRAASRLLPSRSQPQAPRALTFEAPANEASPFCLGPFQQFDVDQFSALRRVGDGIASPPKICKRFHPDGS